MDLSYFPLSGKCIWNCLNCTLPLETSFHTLNKILSYSANNSLNIFSHYNLNTDNLSKINILAKEINQNTAIICHGNISEEIANIKADFLLFPFFSLIPEQHNQFVGSNSFHNLLSMMNHLPKTQKKIVLFFINKDYFSECADLDTFSKSVNAKIWVIPLNLYSNNDYSQEDYLYIKRLALYKTLVLHPISLKLLRRNPSQNDKCHLLQTDLQPQTLLEKIQVWWFTKKLFKIF